MRFKTLMTVIAALASCFGVACLLSPAAMLSSYGVSLKPIGLVVYQLMGAALVGVGTLSWLARDTEAPRRRRATALGLAAVFGISSAVAVKGQLVGANVFGWSTVALYGLLALGLAFAGLTEGRARRGSE